MRALDYVPAAALVVPTLLRPGGRLHVSPDNLRLIAGITAARAAWYSRSILLTSGIGMTTLWVLQALPGM